MTNLQVKNHLNDVFILSAVRTPIGSFLGSLSSLTATQLGGAAIKASLERAAIKREDIDEMYFGNISQALNGGSPALQAAIFGGLSSSTVCTSVNKMCASGMKAIMLASQTLRLGEQEITLAGGMESMSNIPFYLKRGQTPIGGVCDADPNDKNKTIDGLVATLTDDVHNCLMGHIAEKTAEKFNVTREDQDKFAISSYQKTEKAWKSHVFENEVIPIKVNESSIMVNEDDEYKKFNAEKFPKLRTIFKPNGGTITAGNGSSLSDGAAALILASSKAVDRLNLKPLAEVVAWADAALEPMDFPVAPTAAIEKLLETTGVSKDDVALWEINEAFSVVVLANVRLLNLDPSKVNVHGGAVGMGHPVGMSGARLVVHLVHALKNGQIGVAAICNGGGGASAIMIKKL